MTFDLLIYVLCVGEEGKQEAAGMKKTNKPVLRISNDLLDFIY